MATKCPRGSMFDEGGICGCGAGHEDPAMLVDDVARSLGAIMPQSCSLPQCTRPGCRKSLEEGGHTLECLEFWRAAASPS